MTITKTTDQGSSWAQQRAATIRGLIDLACYLEAHPDVPAPQYGPRILVPLDNDDRAAVVAAAEGLDVGTRERGGCVETVREFGGGVAYVVYSLSSERMAAHYALHSYDGNVVPEPVSA